MNLFFCGTHWINYISKIMTKIIHLLEKEKSNEYTFTGKNSYFLILTDGVFAVGLTKNQYNEIIIHILFEDDGCIFETSQDTVNFHSYWFMRYHEFIKNISFYMDENFEKNISGYKYA